MKEHTESKTYGQLTPWLHVERMDLCRVKLAIHRDTGECVAVKIVEVDPSGALTPECLKKEVRTYT